MTDFDVIIVGLGPTGAVAANLLGEANIRTAVFERDTGVYQLPRAVHFDAEIMRTFQRLGLADEVAAISEPTFGMEFVNAEGERLFGTMARGARGEMGPLGWVRGYMFYQPTLDAVLRDAVARYPSIELHLEHDVVAVMNSQADPASEGASVTVEDRTTGERRDVSARYVLAADGASSPLRRMLGTGLESLGFDQHWLVVDTMLKREVDLPHSSQQICRSSRPSTFVHSTGNHRRWEFQLQDGEDPEAMSQPDIVWELLSDWITPDDAELIRHVVYEFHGLVADRWRDGNVFLLGDAAHQMPPFQGQGMCSGIRDAANLGWKLRGVLEGRWPDAVLDSYEPERKPHAVAVVDSSVRVGKLIDWIAATHEAGRDLESPEAVEERNNATRRLAFPRFEHGVVQPSPEGAAPVGLQIPQPQLGEGVARHHFDDDLGEGFALVLAAGRDDLATPTIRGLLDRLEGHCLAAPDTPEVTAHPLGALLAEHPAVLVRPDRYIHGLAHTPAEVDALAATLAEQLQLEG